MITSAQIIEKLEEVVAEFGADYVYQRPDGKPLMGGEGCMYVHGSSPGCIAAQVFVKLGYSLETLGQYEGKQAMSVAKAVGGFTAKAAYTLRVAQEVQDGGHSWGTALRRAKDWSASSYCDDFRLMDPSDFPLV